MLHHHRLVAEALFGDFEKEDTSPAVIDEFMSALIVGYEEALESGCQQRFENPSKPAV